MNRSRALVLFFAVTASLAMSCSERANAPSANVENETAPAASVPSALPGAVLPLAKGLFSPSEMRLVNDARVGDEGARISDSDTCEGCHADAAAAWRTSAHAAASLDNPIYRVAVDRFRRDRGNHASAFCAGCHDVALLASGAMDSDIAPADARAHAGVSCRVCHGIANATVDGNGSFTLDTSDIPIPKIGDNRSLEMHRARVASSALRTNEMCIACHRATLDEGSGNSHHLVGQDDATPWMRSAYAGSRAERVDLEVSEKNCTSCHMPKVDSKNDQGSKNGRLASHEFLGGHTFLRAMSGDAAALSRAQNFLKGAATIRIGAVVFAGKSAVNYVQNAPISISPGDDARLDVVVKNERVGHRFPGGVIDANDTFIEVVVKDAQGHVVADDAGSHVLTSYLANQNGVRLVARETHEFAANVWNTSIAPRDAVVVSYSFHVPDLAREAFPLSVSARLRHRTRNLTLAALACEDSKTERGRAFRVEGQKKGARLLDACAAEPITDIDATTVFLGDFVPAQASPASPFRDAYNYAEGMSHVVQERLDEAARAFAHAMDIAPDDESRATAEAGLADIFAKQGRADDARTHVENATRVLGPHPALARILGDSLMPTWQWKDAATYFADAAQDSPRDDALWSALATTRGGAMDPRGALDAAIIGLHQNPRDENLLRAQALALAILLPSSKEHELAEASYLDRRAPDDAPQIRAACSRRVAGCANERLRVHVHEMRQKPAFLRP